MTVLVRDSGEAQLIDELLGAVVAAVRPVRRAGHGPAWEALLAEESRIRDWIERDKLMLTNIHGKLSRCGVEVPYRTLHRFATERYGFGHLPVRDWTNGSAGVVGGQHDSVNPMIGGWCPAAGCRPAPRRERLS